MKKRKKRKKLAHVVVVPGKQNSYSCILASQPATAVQTKVQFQDQNNIYIHTYIYIKDKIETELSVFMPLHSCPESGKGAELN